jgi:flavin-dependent dehydrogenase
MSRTVLSGDNLQFRDLSQDLVEKFDIAVLGGGPCGCSAAIAACRAGARALLVTRPSRRYWQPPELVPVEVQSALCALGIDGTALLKRHARVAHQRIDWGKTFGTQTGGLIRPQSGVIIDRPAFDAELLEHARQAGVFVLVESVEALQNTGGFWKLWMRSKLSVRADLILIATGRGTFPGSNINPLLHADRLIAVSVQSTLNLNRHRSFSNWRKRSPTYDEFILASTSGGWCYSLVGQSSSSYAVYLTDPDLLPKGWKGQPEKIVGMLPSELRLPKNGILFSNKVSAHPAATAARANAAGPGWALAGDARLSLDPLSGAGVCRALDDGARVAIWLLSSPIAEERRQFRIRHASEYNDLLEIRKRAYAAETRHVGSFWTRRA